MKRSTFLAVCIFAAMLPLAYADTFYQERVFLTPAMDDGQASCSKKPVAGGYRRGKITDVDAYVHGKKMRRSWAAIGTIYKRDGNKIVVWPHSSTTVIAQRNRGHASIKLVLRCRLREDY